MQYVKAYHKIPELVNDLNEFIKVKTLNENTRKELFFIKDTLLGNT